MDLGAAVSIDLALFAVGCLSAVIAFWRGKGIFRFISLGCGVLTFPFAVFSSATHHPAEGAIYEYSGLIFGLLLGSIFAAIAIEEASPTLPPGINGGG